MDVCSCREFSVTVALSFNIALNLKQNWETPPKMFSRHCWPLCTSMCSILAHYDILACQTIPSSNVSGALPSSPSISSGFSHLIGQAMTMLLPCMCTGVVSWHKAVSKMYAAQCALMTYETKMVCSVIKILPVSVLLGNKNAFLRVWVFFFFAPQLQV